MMPCTWRWGARSRYQELCVAGLVGAQKMCASVTPKFLMWNIPSEHDLKLTFWAWPQTDIPSATSNWYSERDLKLTFWSNQHSWFHCDCKFTFLSVTNTCACMHVHTYPHPENRSPIQSLMLMCSAIKKHEVNMYTNCNTFYLFV